MRALPTRLLTPAVLAVAALAAAVPSGTAVAVAGTASTDSAERTAVEERTVSPATLPRGAGPAVAQVLGTTLLHRDLRIEVPGREVQLLGMSGDDYVIARWLENGDNRIERVTAAGARTTVVAGADAGVVLSEDGRHLLLTHVREDARTVVTVRDALTGDRVARHTFRGYVRVLDADKDRAVLGGSAPARTFWWNTRTAATARIAARSGYFADIRADRVAMFTADPYAGGCSVLSTLSAPSEVLWRSCRQAVVATSPQGRRLLTQHLRMDGPVGELSVRGTRGRLRAVYRAPGHFGPAAWETDRRFLVLTLGTRKTALVRCEPGACERVSERIDS